MAALVNSRTSSGISTLLSRPKNTSQTGFNALGRTTQLPNLAIDFTNGNALDPRITFTRDSAATRTNAQGLIETTPVNLLTYSNGLSNTPWTGGATLTANAVTSPDGSTNGSLLVETSTNAEQHRYFFGTSITGTAAAVSFSIFAKASTRSAVTLSVANIGGASYAVATYDLASGTVSKTGGVNYSVTSTAITPVGNGWYRCVLNANVSSGPASYAVISISNSTNPTYTIFGTVPYLGDGTSGIYLWGAQLEQRSQASTYIPTTSSISGAPRFDYDPVTLAPKGLLIEEQRTNLLSASQDFEAPDWKKNNTTVNANCVVAPDGTLTADKLVESTANSTHVAFQQNFTIGANGYAAASVFVKSGERSKIKLSITDTATGAPSAIFDLSSGAISTAAAASGNWQGATAAIVNYGNGWYRCTVTGQKTSGANSTSQPTLSIITGTTTDTYTGDGTSGIYIWGAQLEAGAFATSYVATPISFTSRASTATYRGTNGLIQTAASNVARYEPNSSGGSNLLLESAATNLLTYSENFDNAAWTKSNVTVTADSVTAPDGLNTADTISATISNACRATQTVTIATSTAVVLSCFMKAGTGNGALSYSNGGGLNVSYAKFDLSSGTVSATSASTATISPVGNGWYRCAMAFTTGIANGVCAAHVWDGSADSFGYPGTATGKTVYAWGAQLETGSVATSYVPSVETFTSRASQGSFVGSDGLVQFSGTNLLTYSENFDNAAWSKTRSSITANAATAPDGTVTADKLIEDSTATSTHWAYGTVTLSAVTYTYSVYVKAAERSVVRVSISSTGNGEGADFDLTTGVASNVTSGFSATAVSFGNGWWRCSVSATATAGTNYAGVYVNGQASYTGNGTSGIYIWGAQLEQANKAGTYRVTTGSAITAHPARISYNPANLSVPGKLLLEPAATNLILYSEQFDNAAWSKTDASITANAVVAPDGTTTADKLIEAATTNIHRIYGAPYPVTITNGGIYTLSIFAKSAERNWVAISLPGTGSTYAYFNLSSGSAGNKQANVLASSITSVGNGWYRCSITVTAGVVSGGFDVGIASADGINSYTGDGTSGIYIWGAQLETGTSATSYIPTTTAQVTRAADVSTSAQGTRAADVYSAPTVTRSADVASITGTNFSSWYNQSEGTLFAEFDSKSAGSFEFDGGTVLTRMGLSLQYDTSTKTSAFAVTSGGNSFAYQTGYSSGSASKNAMSYAANTLVNSLNGQSATSSNSVFSAPSFAIRFSLGSNAVNGSGYLNGHIKRIAYYPKRLSNTELQAVTA